MRDYFKKALTNIFRHGNTDIFPFPFERYLFEQKLEEAGERDYWQTRNAGG
jgi:hypothetical protein